MPRPMITMAMPKLRMPRTATFCSNAIMLSAVRKPGRKSEKPTNSSTKMPKTIPCCVTRCFRILLPLGKIRLSDDHIIEYCLRASQHLRLRIAKSFARNGRMKVAHAARTRRSQQRVRVTRAFDFEQSFEDRKVRANRMSLQFEKLNVPSAYQAVS